MIRPPPRSTRKESSAASDVYKRQFLRGSRPLAALARFQKVPGPPPTRPRQDSWGSFGPRAAKCVTTHFCGPPKLLACFWSVMSGLLFSPSGRLQAFRPLQPRAASPEKLAPASPRTCVSLRPHAISRPRPLARSQGLSPHRRESYRFAPFQVFPPKPRQTPAPLRAYRGEGIT